MKNIVSIVGSPRGHNSKTYEIVCDIVEKLKIKEADIASKTFVLSELKINKCIGCTRCFLECSPCRTFKDDMTTIEETMFNADLIIFGSPVYAHNITGEMKNFIDRLSHYLHVLRFAGKCGVTISTSSSNGNMFVDNYLRHIMRCLGINIIDNISYMEHGNFHESSIDKCVDNIIYSLNNEVPLQDYEYQNKMFNIYKNTFVENYKKSISDSNIKPTKETCYWHDNGYFKYNSFKDLFNAMKNDKK